MSDNKTKTGTQDNIKVDVNDADEVEYLHSQFPDFTHSEILDAIKKSGPLRRDIVRYLTSLKNSDR